MSERSSRDAKRVEDRQPSMEGRASAGTRKRVGPKHVRTAVETSRRSTSANVLLIVIAILCIVLAVAGIYYIHLDNTIRAQDEDLLESLAATEPGEPFYMLLLGVDKGAERVADEDYGADESAYRADTIMLCRIDPKNVKATIVSIHRDLLTVLNGEYAKVNAAYSLGGPAGMVEAVNDLAGVDISHYAEIDFDAFIGIVDEIGGIEVTLPVDVYDPDYTELDLKAGTHVLNGHDALMLCRSRHAYDEYGDGDLYRAANQRMVIASIVRKVLKSDATTMVKAISAMAGSLTCDLSLNEILTLAAQMRDFDTDRDLYTGMTPTEPEVVDDIYYEIMDDEAWERMMRRVDAGLSPAEGTDETAGVAGSVHGLSDESISQLVEPGAAKQGDAASVGTRTTTSESGKESRHETAKDAGSFEGMTVSLFGAELDRASAIADALEDVGLDVSTEVDESYGYEKDLIVYEDPALADRARELAAYLGDGFTATENDGSFYVDTDFVIWLAS